MASIGTVLLAAESVSPKSRSNLPRLCRAFVALQLTMAGYPAQAQPALKAGYVVSAIVQVGAETDASGDYRPYFGYEVDGLQGYPADGLQIGVSYTLPVLNYLVVRPEVSYVQRGMDGYGKDLYDASYRLELDYIEVAVPVVLRPKPSWRFSPGIILGPYGAALVRNSRTVRVGDDTNRGSESQLSSLDSGIVLGADVLFEALAGTWTVELRLNWGFTRTVGLPDDPVRLYDDPGTMHTAAAVLLLGYRFR